MPGYVDFVLSGRIKSVRDTNPSQDRYGNGKLTVLLSVPPTTLETRTVPAHSVFIDIKYSNKDESNAYFQKVKSRTVAGNWMFIKGTIKPWDNGIRSGLNLNAHWREVQISNEVIENINRVMGNVELKNWDSNNGIVHIKYGYQNPKNKEWKDRDFTLLTSINCNKQLHDTLYFEGQYFGVSPAGEKYQWIYADKVF